LNVYPKQKTPADKKKIIYSDCNITCPGTGKGTIQLAIHVSLNINTNYQQNKKTRRGTPKKRQYALDTSSVAKNPAPLEVSITISIAMYTSLMSLGVPNIMSC
jgi:hypothetical protein